MLPKNFDFTQLPEDKKDFSLKEIGMLGSNIEDIDYAMTSWLKEDLDLTTMTNEGYKECQYCGKHRKEPFRLKIIMI